MGLEYFSFILASMILAFSPGPDNIFVFVTSLTNGFNAALKFIFGLMTGIVLHTSLIILGVSEAIKSSEAGLIILKIFSVCYLCWLAFLTFKHRKATLNLESKETKSSQNFYIRGFVMNISNPKVLLFFLAFLPSFAQLDQSGFELRLITLGVLFALVTLIVFGLIAWVADKGMKQKIQSSDTMIYINWMAFIVFLSMAAFLALS